MPQLFAAISIAASIFATGFALGSMLSDSMMMRLLRSQQSRGDYWFDKYMKEVAPDWEPLSQNFDE